MQNNRTEDRMKKECLQKRRERLYVTARRTVTAVLAVAAVSALLAACTYDNTSPALPAAARPLETDGGTASDSADSSSSLPAQTTDEPSASLSEEQPAEPPLPQTVPVRNGYLAGIENAEAISDITALFSAADAQGAAIYCYDIDSGMTFCSDPAKLYTAQSVIKAPYVMAVLRDLGSDAERMLDEPVTVDSRTVRELMESTIRISDNAAYLALYHRFGDEPFNALAQELGLSARLNGAPYGRCTVEEMGILFREILFGDYAQKAFLMELLTDTKFNFLINTVLPNIKIAHKYGLNTDTGDCHDAAIVFDTHPYILVIFSVHDPEAAVPYAPLRALARRAVASHSALRPQDRT